MMQDSEQHQLEYSVKRTPPVDWRKMLLVVVIATLVIIAVSFIILPAPHVHRPPSSASRLRNITHSAIGYAADYDEFPDSFETLVRSEWTLPAGVFASPNGRATPAPDHETMLRKPGHISYVWLGTGLTMETVHADTPLAYEGPVTDFEAGTLVGFADGSVELIKGEELRKLLSDAEARLRNATTVSFTRPATSPTTATSGEGPDMLGE